MKKLLLLLPLLAMLTFSGFSQADKFWSVNNESRSNIIADKAVSRQSYPKAIKLFNINFESFRNQLHSIVGKSSKTSTVISLPNAGGTIEQFEVFEASNFEPALQARFPEIRAYSGKGITDKYATLKLSISPQGVQSMVFRTEKDNEFMEPYSKDHAVYAVYSSHREKGMLPWSCSTEETKIVTGLNQQISNSHITGRSTGDLKVMRLAQSVNAEYSNYFGATSAAQVGLVLAAINATLARCNGVYEKDLALHLNIVANDTAVIFYKASTDPYTTYNVGNGISDWNAQLQTTLTAKIGESNYDIGHMFGSNGGGGNAGCIGCICVNGQKGSGITSPADGIPMGDNFDIDYVVHEVGHQMGGNHTFSMSNEGTGVNKEIGSGITIMGYAGITSQDVAPHSIDIYHEATIAQIQTNLTSKTCPVTTVVSATNATPVVATVAAHTIPISTPFALTGSATDANPNDVLTYCWEQNDNASSSQTAANSIAKPTKATGPNWLSFSPSVSPTKYFPQLKTILAGGLTSGPLPGGDAGTTIEALSSVSRTLNFRLTVRDNAVYSSTPPVSVGQTAFTDVAITVTNTSGPFAVTSPNTGVTWAGGSSQVITWSVANTTLAPVSCSNVKISLSTDGGITFPTVLDANTANDGTDTVTIPNVPTATARIKIESVGNIFFDISNTNFTISSITGCGSVSGLTSSAITQTSANVSWLAASNAVSYVLQYKTAAATTYTNVTGITSTSYNLTGLTAATTYNFQVRATCPSDTSAFSAPQNFTTLNSNTNCVDVYENNNTLATAAAIPVNTAIVGLIGITGDNDYFSFSNTANQPNIKVSLSNLPADYDLKLYSPSGVLLNTSSNSGMTAESITYNTTVVGNYKAYVYGYKGVRNATKCYTMQAQIGTSPFKFASTGRSANVSSDAAKQAISSVKVYPSPAHGTVSLTINGYEKGDAQVTVINQSGVRVLSKKITTNIYEMNTKLDITTLPEGLYYVKVQQGNSSNMEKLVVTK